MDQVRAHPYPYHRESIRVRDAIIEKFIDKSLDDLNNFFSIRIRCRKR